MSHWIIAGVLLSGISIAIWLFRRRTAHADARIFMLDAIRRGDIKTVETLLQSGVEPDIREVMLRRPMESPFTTSVVESAFQQHARTALMIAAYEGQLDICRMLLDYGAHIDATNASGWNALLSAIDASHPKVVTLLLRSGADVNSTTTEGETALIYAAGKGDLGCVNVLLNNGAAIDARNADGGTALIYAAANGHIQVVEALLAKGASMSVTDNDGLTALAWAQRNGEDEITVLLAHGHRREGAQ